MIAQTKKTRVQKKLEKKAELSTETMVMIALALLFLIIVAFVMTGKIKIFSSTLGDCENKGGICKSKGTCYGTETGFDCSEKTHVCCMNICEGSIGTCTSETNGCGDKEQVYTAACEKENQVCCK